MIITVKHNFETAHRLPFLEGKCQSIHGHSWKVEWAFEETMDANGLTIEYGAIKKKLRDWVDLYLDHGTMLGADDKLLDAFIADGGKIFLFGHSAKVSNNYIYRPWPTVEAVAEMLSWAAFQATGLQPVSVKVQETEVNSAIWTEETL